MLIPVLIFCATYLVFALGRLPGLRVDRSGAAIIGATLMIASKTLSVQDAYAAVDYNTIILLFGMMIVVAHLRVSGFFTLVSAWVVAHARRPIVLLAAIVFVSGFFSAFFVNDTMCLVLTPLVLEVTSRMRRNPLPYLLAVAMAANIGSVATITGNPQNMMIGSFSGISYRAFAAALAPVAAVGLLVLIVLLSIIYRREFREERALAVEQPLVAVDRILLWKSLLVAAAMTVFFFAGWPVAEVALAAGSLLLISRRVGPETIYREIDWQLLVTFIGLFIVIAGVERTDLATNVLAAFSRLGMQRTGWLAAYTGILSNVVSNVPAVLVMKPLLVHLPDARHAWLTLAMSSTLAGNLTVLGSVANLIVVERARHQAPISFWEYAKAGVPVTVATIAMGIWWLG